MATMDTLFEHLREIIEKEARSYRENQGIDPATTE